MSAMNTRLALKFFIDDRKEEFVNDDDFMLHSVPDDVCETVMTTLKTRNFS